MHALTKFKQYLVGYKFVVKTDHNNLKYFLEQKDLNERQKKWVTKVHAFDFDIEYVKGKKNIVVDALSRRTMFVLAKSRLSFDPELPDRSCRTNIDTMDFLLY
jgi:hypothetical protein